MANRLGEAEPHCPTREELEKIIDEMSRERRAWRDLEIPDTAPTPERQAALFRGFHAAKVILRAVRTLGNPAAHPEDVALAIALTNEAACIGGPTDIDRAMQLVFVRSIDEAAARNSTGASQLRELIDAYPDLAGANEAAYVAAVEAWRASSRDRARSPAVWRKVIAAMRSAGLPNLTVVAMRKAWKRFREPTSRRLGRRKRHSR